MQIGLRRVCARCGQGHSSAPSDRSDTLCPGCLALGDGSASDDAAARIPASLDARASGTERIHRIPDAQEDAVHTVGRFRLCEPLGRGSFGQVYRAYDPRLDRIIALKVLRKREPSGRVMERFFREARAAAQLDHPRIVPLHDAGRDGDWCWIAYQYVPGVSLAERCRSHRFGPLEIARLGLGLAQALEHAHGRGVVHRDLKPANVLLDREGQPRLTDFGLARRESCDPDLTRLGSILGTRAYMSPEQAAGRSHVVDPRSDLYSLGIILFELLTGHRPDPGAADFRGERLRADRLIAPLAQLPRHLAGPLEQICRIALAPDPADRYGDATAMAQTLDRFLSRRAHRRGWLWQSALRRSI